MLSPEHLFPLKTSSSGGQKRLKNTTGNEMSCGGASAYILIPRSRVRGWALVVRAKEIEWWGVGPEGGRGKPQAFRVPPAQYVGSALFRPLDMALAFLIGSYLFYRNLPYFTFKKNKFPLVFQSYLDKKILLCMFKKNALFFYQRSILTCFPAI